jgi:hypothetical protein
LAPPAGTRLGVTDDRVSDDRVAHHGVTDDGVADDGVTDDGVSDHRACLDGAEASPRLDRPVGEEDVVGLGMEAGRPQESHDAQSVTLVDQAHEVAVSFGAFNCRASMLLYDMEVQQTAQYAEVVVRSQPDEHLAWNVGRSAGTGNHTDSP